MNQRLQQFPGTVTAAPCQKQETDHPGLSAVS